MFARIQIPGRKFPLSKSRSHGENPQGRALPPLEFSFGTCRCCREQEHHDYVLGFKYEVRHAYMNLGLCTCELSSSFEIS